MRSSYSSNNIPNDVRRQSPRHDPDAQRNYSPDDPRNKLQSKILGYKRFLAEPQSMGKRSKIRKQIKQLKAEIKDLSILDLLIDHEPQGTSFVSEYKYSHTKSVFGDTGWDLGI